MQGWQIDRRRHSEIQRLLGEGKVEVFYRSVVLRNMDSEKEVSNEFAIDDNDEDLIMEEE